jgi:hypothetical protein
MSVPLDWYDEACDRAEYAEFVLLVYHHLVCLFDADEVRGRELAKKPVPYDSRPYDAPVATPWYTAPGMRCDTSGTAYRHNHISQKEWDILTPRHRSSFILELAKRLGKSVVDS